MTVLLARRAEEPNSLLPILPGAVRFAQGCAKIPCRGAGRVAFNQCYKADLCSTPASEHSNAAIPQTDLSPVKKEKIPRHVPIFHCCKHRE